MLTCKSNLFKKQLGEEMTFDMLKKLYNNIIISEYANFRGTLSMGYPESIAGTILGKIDTSKLNAKILILNDLGFQMYKTLNDTGFEKNNIILAYGKWEKKGIVANDEKVYNTIRMFAGSNFREFENDLSNIIPLKEIFTMSIKFDYIIANPPYAIGNQITRAVLDNVDFKEYINLMPASKYKGGDLFKKVASVESAEDAFEDASVGDSLTVAVLKNEDGLYENYEDFSNEFRDPRFVAFYKLNAKCSVKYPYTYSALFFKGADECSKQQALRTMQNYYNNIATTFCCTWRTVLDGAHKTENCFDYGWNISGNVDIEAPIHQSDHQSEKRNNTCITVDFIDMHTPQEKSNLCIFWYKNPLLNCLLKGLNKTMGTAAPAIPNIDYSKDRDYEHLTLEDLMNILREENPDVSQ